MSCRDAESAENSEYLTDTNQPNIMPIHFLFSASCGPLRLIE